jgi:cyclopropane-fatty-acyl-phospholipid synthase
MISPSPTRSHPLLEVPARCAPLSTMDRLARGALARTLTRLGGGRLQVTDADGSQEFGGSRLTDGPDFETACPMNAAIVVHDPAFYRHAVAGGNLAIAESYFRGEWSCSDLTSLFRLFTRNIQLSDSMDRGINRLLQWPARIYHALRANTLSGSRRNIHRHYDLGNDFFALMLDETMAYSSGIYANGATSLYEASVEKMDRLCRKLDLRPGDQLLEIGTGWGGLAIHAAQHYGCHVTTTTISREQHREAAQRVERAGVSDRVTLLLSDYRELSRELGGRFDKLVSVEMIEAVGHKYLPAFFGHVSRLLRPEGTAAIQAIVMGEQRHAQYLRSVDFIQRYVFPGGCLPSVGSLVEASGRGSDLRMVHLEDFAEHYARTLFDWRQRFVDRLDDVQRLGYPTRFVRLWNYYLSYCEAGFAERYLSVAHLQFDKPGCDRDPLELTRSAADQAFVASSRRQPQGSRS